jgi:hypothetical protein
LSIVEDGTRTNKKIKNIVYRTSIITFPEKTCFKEFTEFVSFPLGFFLNTVNATKANKNNENNVIKVVDVVDLGSVCGTYNKIIGNNAIDRMTRAINRLNPNITLSFGGFMG